LRTNPSAVLQNYWPIPKGHLGPTVIMIAGAEESALGDAAVGSHGNGFQIQEENFLSYPGVVANRKLPREVNVHARFNDHAAPHTRPKHPENNALQTGGKGQCTQKENALHQVPSCFDNEGTTAIQPFAGAKEIVADASG
jgi:hypothetical protein